MTVLADVVEIYDGPHATPTRRDSGPYFLNISSLKSGRLDLSESDHVSEEDFTRWTRRMQPQAGDLLFSYETRLGEAALMPEGVRACLGRRMGVLRPDRTVLDPRYLLYYFLSPAFQDLVSERTVHGATVPRLLLSEMGSWPVELPGLATQTAIADVLGALDDKIAANERAATLAGQLIRALARPRDDATSAELASVAELVARGRAPRYVDHGGMFVVNQKCVRGGTVGLSDARRTSGCSPDDDRALRRLDVLINSTGQGTLGRVGIWNRPAAASVDSHVTIVRVDSTKADPAYIAAQLIGREADFESLAAGSTGQTELARAHVLAFAVSLPTREHQELAGRKINALLDKIQTLSVESERLAATRDALLPELMSGRLAVGRATEVVP